MPQLLPLPVNQRAIAAMLTPFYFLFQSKKLLLRLAMLVMSVGMMSGVVGQATVTSDKDDYAPRSNAVFTGSGFAPGETVTLRVKNLSRPCNTIAPDSSYLPWTVVADASGGFVTNWTVCDCNGDSLRLKATGMTSGLFAYAYFTDANPNSLAIAQTSLTVTAGNSVSSNFTINAGGNNNDCTITLSTNLPTDATISISGGNPFIINGTSTKLMTINTLSTLLPGTYSYTLTAQRGVNCQGSGNLTATGTLIVNAPTSLSAVSGSGIYGAAVTLTATLNPNLSGQSVSFSLGSSTWNASTNGSGVATVLVPFTSIPAAFKNAGTYTNAVGVSFAGNANYSASSATGNLTIGKATATVVVNPYSVTYDGLPHTSSYSITGVNSESGATVGTVNVSATMHTNAGTYNNDAWSFTGTANYNDANGTVNNAIGKRPITITAVAAQKYCGQVDPAFVANVTSGTIVNNDQASGSLTRSDLTNVDVGVYSILKGTYTFGPNYEETYGPANFTILGVAIDASTSSATVPIGQTARLKAVVTDGVNGVEGVAVKFEIKNSSGSIIQTKNTTSGANGLIDIPADALTLGVYQVIATAGAGCGTSTAYITMYDANENFVTGGGWISSPAGALTADPLAVGKANFGFVSKYKKGSSQVDGNTEFQFQAGNVNFKSTMHESGSLVISGGKATYRGTGTVNGLTGYKFVIVAIDGNWNNGVNPDRFRIKITTTSGQTVYDNQMNSAENADDATELGGGSIVIHEVKKKTSNRMDAPALVIATQEFNVKILGNPSLTTFRLQLQGSNMQEKFMVKVVDMNGRLIEVQQNLYAGQVIELGSKYTQGTYFAEVTQGTNRKVVKLVKISRD